VENEISNLENEFVPAFDVQVKVGCKKGHRVEHDLFVYQSQI
jgi:hypothetical protein